jgi:hypothetical protein
MGGVVTAQFIIGSNSRLTREQVDKIMEALDIRDDEGHLLKPPVGENCNYVLVLEKDDIDVPMDNGDNSS